jgi:hypothetical protein
MIFSRSNHYLLNNMNTYQHLIGKKYYYWLVPVSFFFVLFLADIIIFRILFWKIPDTTGIEESQHYSFLHRYHNRKKSYVWIAGSSVAMYGLDAGMLGKITGQSVNLFSHQGMNPVHLLAWSSEIIAEKPDTLILPVNPVDLRIERYAVKGSDLC